MQSGSPFYHFKSKNALLYAVMESGMGSALERQNQVVSASDYSTLLPAAQLRALVRMHFEVLLGPGNDFVPVMLYEIRSLNARQHKMVTALVTQYESTWIPVLQALHDSGQLRASVPLARLLILGALNWTVQWFNPKKGVSLQGLTDAAMALFIEEV
jgi:AcrR family transcriptional regulator